MIAALFALAAAMVIGGCAAVIQGFPYVRLESGLALVIAGSVAASSGAVLFGLGVVAAGLRRVERAAGRAPAPLASEAGEAPHPASEGRPRLPPVLPAAPAFVMPPVVAPPSVELPFDAARLRIEPGFGPQESHATENHPSENHGADHARPPASGGMAEGALAAAPAVAEAEPELPIPGLAPAVSAAPPSAPDPAHPAEPEAAPEPAHGIAPEDDLFAAPEAYHPDASHPEASHPEASHPEASHPEASPPETDAPGEAPALRPSLDAAPEAEPETGPAKVERTVVGRYASGGNTYLMFEDGSIEAATPQGRFTFASLDELKAFVDGGGEAGARGAA